MEGGYTFGMMRPLRSRRGQIVIPAMLIFPTLFLFVYLIYETAKLSREKIRHQFAMDAAAFVELTNYSDFLNRSAYVNGAFPMRIFEEGYYDFMADCEGKVQNCNQKTYASILFQNGAFPHLGGSYANGHNPEGQSAFQGLGKWSIQYDNNRASRKNENPPDLTSWMPPGSADIAKHYELFTMDDADNYWHPYDLATEIYKLYVQIYSLLGSVEDAQYQVLTRLTTGGSVPHSFLQKSYWLNTGDPAGDASVLAKSFDLALGNFPGAVHPNCLGKMDYWGNQHLNNGGIQPYVPEMTTPDIVLSQVTAGAGCNSSDGNVNVDGNGGLFQIESLDSSMVNTLKSGLSISMDWSIPKKNFFNVDFAAMMAQQYPNQELHTTISVIGDPSTTPAVGPDPTPKFQVRQFP